METQETLQLPFMQPGGMDPATREQFYDRALEYGPFFDQESGLWVVSDYNNVRKILGDPGNYSNSLTLIPHYPICKEAEDILRNELDAPATTAGGDGETHTRGRRALVRAFPTSETRVDEELGDLVDDMVWALAIDLPNHADEKGRVDLIEHFAWQLPLKVMNRIIGFDESQYEQIKEWSRGQIELTWGRLEPEEQVRAARGLVSLWNACQDLMRKRMNGEGVNIDRPDLATKLTDRVAARDITEKEAASLLLNMAVAGHETTANAIGNTLLRVTPQTNAESDGVLWSTLPNMGDEQAAAVAEEGLRIDPPIGGWSRLTTGNVVVSHGERETTIPAGSRVLLLLSAAQRDPAHFANPHEFDHTVPRDRTLVFGHGIHYCVGAELARRELRSAIQTLATLYPEIRLTDGSVEFYPNIGFVALKRLNARLQPTFE